MILDIASWIFLAIFFFHFWFLCTVIFAEILYKKMDKGFYLSIYMGLLWPIAIVIYGMKPLDEAGKILVEEQRAVKRIQKE